MLIVLALAALVVLITGLPVTQMVGQAFDALFAASSVQALWYVTRAAGADGLFAAVAVHGVGIAVASRIFDPALQGVFTYDFHQFISLLSIGFVALHVLVLLGDRYLPFSVAAILVPFARAVSPAVVGIGVIGFYLTLLVTITFTSAISSGSRLSCDSPVELCRLWIRRHPRLDGRNGLASPGDAVDVRRHHALDRVSYHLLGSRFDCWISDH